MADLIPETPEERAERLHPGEEIARWKRQADLYLRLFGAAMDELEAIAADPARALSLIERGIVEPVLPDGFMYGPGLLKAAKRA